MCVFQLYKLWLQRSYVTQVVVKRGAAEADGRGTFVRLTRIQKGGALDRSNRMNPMTMLRIGDCVVAVDGTPCVT